MGAHVTVLSHSPGKRDDALALGDDFIVAKDEAVFRENAGRFDLLIDTVSAAHDYNAYLNLLRRDGTMVLVGLPEPTPLSAGPLIAASQACGIIDWRHSRDPGDAGFLWAAQRCRRRGGDPRSGDQPGL
jgi:D-arabinose 1-dehydrogenase-like Zn-dependent alcohol dehydrogenase